VKISMIKGVIRSLIRFLWLLVKIIFGLAATISMLLAVLLFTPVGLKLSTEWITEKMPAIEISGMQGRWLDDITIAQITWTTPSQQLILNDIEFRLAPQCLLAVKLCVDKLNINSVSFKSQTTSSNTPIVLPNLVSILPIEIRDSAINRIELAMKGGQHEAEPQQIDDLRFENLRLWGSTLSVENTSVIIAGYAVSFNGHIQLKDNYPLNLTADFLHAQKNQLWSVDLNGDLEKLNWSLKPTNQYGIRGSGTVDLIKDSLPFNGEFSSDKPNSFSQADSKVDIKNLNAAVVGKLRNADKGPHLTFNLQSNLNELSKADKTIKNILLTAKGGYEQKTIHFEEIQLLQDNKNKLISQGVVNIDEGIHWDLQVQTDYFDVAGFVDNLITKDPSQSRPPQVITGSATVKGALRSEHDYIEISQLTASTEYDGQVAKLTGDVKYQQGNFQFGNVFFNLGENKLSFDGSYPDGSIVSDFKLTKLEDLPFQQLDARLKSPIYGSAIGHIQMTLVKHQILSMESNAQFQRLRYDNYAIDSAEMNSVINNKSSTIKANLVMHTLNYGDRGLGDINLNVNGPHSAPELAFTWQKNANEKVDAHCVGKSNRKLPTIAFECNQMAFYSADEQGQFSWQLADLFKLTINKKEKKIYGSPFCLANGEQHICATSAFLFSPTGIADLSLHANHLSWHWLTPYMPKNLQPKGDWSLEINGLSLAKSGDLKANAIFESKDTAWQWKLNKKKSVAFVSPEIVGHFELNNKSITGKLHVATDLFGNVDIDVNPLDHGNHWALDFKEVDLALLNTFYHVANKIEGKLSGEIGFDYVDTLENLSGQFSIEEGELIANWAVVPLEQINVNGSISQNNVQLVGDFITRGSKGQLDGWFNVKPNDFTGELHINAQNVLYEPLPRSWTRGDPVLAVIFKDRTIQVVGHVEAKKARIKIDKLPENAVDISSDTVIVGDIQKNKYWPFSMKLSVNLGDDVKFRGFGLESELKGNFILWRGPGEKIKGKGVIYIKNGSYRAYGQDLKIQQGKLIYTSSIENPDLDITAVRNRTPEDVTVGLKIFGELSQPNISLFSNPAMSEERKISYLLTGKSPDTKQLGSAEPLDKKTQAQQSALSLGLSLSSARTEKIASRIGIQDFRIGTVQGNTGQEVQLSGQLSSNLNVRYGYQMFDQVSTITARYQLKRDFYIELFRGTANAIDFLWLITGHDE